MLPNLLDWLTNTADPLWLLAAVIVAELVLVLLDPPVA